MSDDDKKSKHPEEIEKAKIGQDKASRRDFIKNAGSVALGGAAMLSAPALASSLSSAPQDSTPKKPLAGKTALITGAARGIGRAIALRYAQDGANVALLDIADPRGLSAIKYPLGSSEELNETAQKAKELGVNVLPIVADVRDLNTMKKAIFNAYDKLGSLDIIVANAGVAATQRFEDQSAEMMQQIMDVNIIGVANTIIPAIPHLGKSPEGGRIIAISSISGRRGIAGTAAYNASKWAVTGMIKTLALELGPMSITANCIAPTAVRTTLLTNAVTGSATEEANAGTLNAIMEEFHSLPVGMLEPEEIANAAAFLAGDQARYVSGMTLDVNAGISGEITG